MLACIIARGIEPTFEQALDGSFDAYIAGEIRKWVSASRSPPMRGCRHGNDVLLQIQWEGLAFKRKLLCPPAYHLMPFVPSEGCKSCDNLCGQR